MKYIDTNNLSEVLRGKSVDIESKRVLLAKLEGSDQENDLLVPTNCNGYGRVRHFRMNRYDDWCSDPLPNLPAAKYFGEEPEETLITQVFQLASCNFRCWYCFVDTDRLSANQKVSKMFSVDELLDLFLKIENPPKVIDLSGGQPDLVPEWTLWMMEELEKRNLVDEYFLWSDDNLSTDYLWKYLSNSQVSYMAQYKGFSRVACFKGFDPVSYSYNTGVSPAHFDIQFQLFAKLLNSGFDIFAYITFTSPRTSELTRKISLSDNSKNSTFSQCPIMLRQ